MSLKDRIQEDMKSAMRAKDSVRLESIRLLRAAIQRREVDDRVTLDDRAVLAVIEKSIKQSRDAIEQFALGGRDDLVTKEQSNIDVLEVYLPEQLTEAEIGDLVAKAVTDSSAASMRDMGKVMALLKPQLQGRADMGLVSAKVKGLLQG